jgi:hypothetical protein
MCTFLFMLHVSAAQGYLQPTHCLRSLLHCALGHIVLLRHVVVLIINFDAIRCFSSYLVLQPFLCPTGILLVVCI